MGRPRQHDESVAEALLDAAERRVAAEGVGALSLRAVAADAGTTTRAVYTLFGSRDGLVGELGVRAMRVLQGAVESLAPTGDPARDVVEATLAYRRFALEHPALFAIAFHDADARSWAPFREAAVEAFAVLRRRVDALAEAGRLGGRDPLTATVQVDALCEGLAWTELRGNRLAPDPESFWRSAVGALVAGFGVPDA